MNGNELSPAHDSVVSALHRAQFRSVRDYRNRRVPGLSIRNDRYYAQLWIELPDGRKVSRRFPLANSDGLAVKTVAEAREALEIKRHERRESALPTGGRKPTFVDYSETYFAKAMLLEKRPRTVDSEQQANARWRKHLGAFRIDKIALPLLATFVDARLKGGASKRTVALDLICLRNVLKAAKEDGIIARLPDFPKVRPGPPPKRSLLMPEQFEALLAACLAMREDGTPVTKNGVQVRDYLRFLAYSGAREQEALRIAWRDVDMVKGQVTIGADGLAKNHHSRTIDCIPQLAALLAEIQSRRAPDSSWLFPSPQRGQRDERAHSLRESLLLVRAHAGLPEIGFHDLRHLFASMCVMAGIDFMTIAEWMGHKDGGILVGKVYGHLLDNHRRKMARRVHVGLAVPRPRRAAH